MKEKETDPVINVHDSTIHVGDTWTAKDNFDNAIDKNGNEVSFSDIKVTGEVDNSKVGNYEVTYHYSGIISVAKIAVKNNKKEFVVSDKNTGNPKRDQIKNIKSDKSNKEFPKTGEKGFVN